jgi:hypothetical protein
MATSVATVAQQHVPVILAIIADEAGFGLGWSGETGVNRTIDAKQMAGRTVFRVYLDGATASTLQYQHT